MNYKIDLVYPCHTKDKDTLELSIEYARKNIINLNNIFVVSKNKLTDNAIWISENIFPFSFQDMIDIIGDHNRTGWYYAGWIHLYSPICIPNITENVLICDSDTIFIKPVNFIDNEGRTLFNISNGDGAPWYFEHMKKLVPNLTPQINTPWSGICHHIVINKNILLNLIKEVEEVHKMPFWKAWIIVTLDKYNSIQSDSNFLNNKYIHRDGPGRATSYELYFNYALKNYNHKVKIRKLNSILSYKGFINVKNLDTIPSIGRRTASRTNIDNKNNHIQIIDKKEENEIIHETIQDCFYYIIKKSQEKGFVQLTLPDHCRIKKDNRNTDSIYR